MLDASVSIIKTGNKTASAIIGAEIDIYEALVNVSRNNPVLTKAIEKAALRLSRINNTRNYQASKKQKPASSTLEKYRFNHENN